VRALWRPFRARSFCGADTQHFRAGLDCGTRWRGLKTISSPSPGWRTVRKILVKEGASGAKALS
jgi:hypothetical protein